MKTLKTLMLLVCSIFLYHSIFSQNLVNNPSFDNYVFNASCSQVNYYICHAPDWHILNNTPDVLHPSDDQSMYAAPRTGVGNARFASPPNGMDEYFYGTTQPLTAGQTYVVSFWVRKDYTTTENIPMGMHIGSSVPSPQQLNPYVQTIVPQITITPTSTQYVKASTCFIATTSGVHYLTFGAFGGNGTGQGQVWLVDDVSVQELQPGEGLQDANLSLAQSEYCTYDEIIVDGSASTDEIEYSWKINRIETNGSETSVYTGALTQGQAGTFNVSQALSSLGLNQPGKCFRIYLKVQNGCSDQTSVDFCFVDPRIQFITDGDPVCENVPIELEVTGDNGWTYEWSTGESGVGMKSITVTPTAPSVQYTVTVTTAPPASCEFTQTLNLVVSSLVGQVAPTMDGIDGTNEYTYYAQSGDVVDFSSLISNNAGEVVMSSFTNINVPGNYSFTLPPINSDGGAFSFNWQTPINSAGSYSFTVDLLDKNGCMPLSNSYTFTIILICDYCPVCIAYDNRTPETFPVPPYTKAGKCIEVAFNDVVRIGAGNSATFQAGDYVAIDPVNFDTDGGTFDVIIDPTTCIEACDDCCSEWNGFTLDLPLPNIISLQSTVGNEIWYVRDDDNPWCAFGATGFELYVLNEWGGTVYKQLSYEGLGCCPFRALGFPSSINWDGRTNVGFNQGEFVSNGVYFYVLYLHGCGQTAMYSGDITVSGSSGMIIQDQSTAQAVEQPFAPAQTETAAVPGNGLPANHFFVFPNPTEGIVRIHASEELQNVQVFDAGGKLVIERSSDFDLPIDLTLFSPGSYRIRTTLANQQIKENTIVKE